MPWRTAAVERGMAAGMVGVVGVVGVVVGGGK